MKKFLLLFLLFAACPFEIYAQDKIFTVSGTVSDSAGKALPYSQILVVTNPDSSLVAFATADDQGNYQVKLKPGNYHFWVSYVGYQKRKRPLTIAPTAKSKITLDFQLEVDALELSEVVIQEQAPIRLKEDTTEYNAADYLTESDRKLKDVLKKLPGVEVDESGKVFVQGEEVKDVMIEGDELYEDNPQLITNTFSAQAVDKIQVLDDFQDPGSLANLNTRKRAINITLREDKKQVILGEVGGGAGISERYKAESNLYYVSKKWKGTLLTNINNVGEKAFSTLDYLRMSGALEDAIAGGGGRVTLSSDDLPLSLASSEMPPRINNYLGALSLIYNPNSKWKIRAYLLNNFEDVSNEQVIRRIYGSEALDVPYRQSTLTERQVLFTDYTGSLIFKPYEKQYWRYDLRLAPRYLQQLGDLDLVFGETNNIFSENNLERGLNFQNRLRGKFTFSESKALAVDMRWQEQFGSTRYRLAANEDPFQTFFNSGSEDTTSLNLRQRLRQPKTELRIDLNYRQELQERWTLQARLGTSQTWEQPRFSIEDELLPADWSSEDLDLSNRFEFQKYYAELVLGFTQGIVNISAGTALARYSYDFRGQLNEASTQQWRWEPSTRLNLQFSRSHSLTMTYNRSNTFPGWDQLNEAIQISSYRSLRGGSDSLQSVPNQTAGLMYRYFNLFSHYFIFANISHTRRDRAFGTNQITSLEADLVTNTNIDFENFTRAFVQAGKDFYGKVPWGLKASAELYQISSQNQFNEDPNDFSNFTQTYNLQLSTRFKKFFNIEFAWKLVRTEFETSLSEQKTVTNNQKLSSKLFFTIHKKCLIRPEFEQVYFSRDGQRQQSIFFSHVTIEYNPSPRLSFRLKAHNLSNARALNNASVNAFYTQITTRQILESYGLLSVVYQF